MRTATFAVTGAALVAGMAMLAKESSSFSGALFFLPFALGPLLVTLLVGAACRSAVSLWLLLGSSIAYSCWFLYIYLDAFHWNLDPQSGIALLFIGIYSLPVMLPVWAIALWKRKEKTPAN